MAFSTLISLLVLGALMNSVVNAGPGTIKLTVTKSEARACPGVRTNEKIELAENGFSYIQTGRSRTPEIKVEQAVNRSIDRQVLEFPSCYDFQFYMYIKKPLFDPEATVNIWLLNSLHNVNCSNTEIASVADNCDDRRTDANSNACRICNVCENIKELQNDVLSRSRTALVTNCGRRCCFEPRQQPYRFKVKKLCLSQSDIDKMFANVDLKQYLLQQKRLFGKKGRDSIRLRLEFTDRNERSVRAVTIGCFEVTLDFVVNGI